MKKIFTLLLLIVSLVGYSQSTTVVISQVYSGGGANTGTPSYKADYVELFNKSTTAQAIGGFSLQYGSATGNFGGSALQIFEFPTGTTIPAGKYLLVQVGNLGTAGGDLAAGFTPDFTTTNLSMGAAGGKVALVKNATGLGCGGNVGTNVPCTLPHSLIVDLVSYGTANNGEGGTSVGTLTTTTSAIRKSSGCIDTDNNAADFDIATPTLRNSASAANTCGTTTTPAITTTGTIADFGNVVVLANSTSQSFTVSGANLTGAPGNITVTAPSTDFQVSLDNTTWTASVNIAYTTATLAATTVHVRFTPQTVGAKTGNISIAGGGTSAAVTVAVSGTGVAAATPTITTTGTITNFGNVVVLTNSTSQSFTVSGANLTGAPGNITVTAPSTDFQVSLDNTTWTASVTIPYTTATLAATTVNVRFTPQTVGAKTGNISITGGGTSAAVTVAVSGTGVNAGPPATTGVRISQVYGAGGNAAASYNQDYVELFNSGTTEVDISDWSVQYASYNGPSGAGNWSAAILPSGSKIGAGKYFLVSFALGAVGSPIPTADFAGPNSVNLSGTAGKVALVNTSTVLNGTTACSHASVVDVIGFSTTANAATCFEGTAFLTTGIANTQAMFRKNNGCTDTNDNSADFELGNTAPRNSASAANPCGTTTTPAITTTGTIADFGNVVVLANSTSQSFTVSGANLTGAPGNITVTAPSTDFQVSLDNTTWTASVNIAYTTATLAATTVHVRFTPQTVGAKTGNISITGGGTSAAVTVAVSGTGVAAATPTITTTGTIADFGNVVILTNSTSQSFTVSGANLTGAPGNITVTAPSTDFQVSLDNTTWTASVTIPYTTATLAATTVNVRFTPQTVGAKTGNISITGGGTSAAVTVAVSGTGVAAATPTITTTGTISDFGNVVILTNSASKSFTVSGANLTGAPGNITVTAPSTDFQVSLDNTTWTASVTIPYTTATLAATTVNVRFTPQTVGAKTGNISITGGGTSAAVTVAVSGTGVNAGPPATTNVRISQVYGAGGNAATSTYNQDYVELFNPGTTEVDISDWSIQYAAFAGPTGAGNWSAAILPSGSKIGAGKYFLVALATASTTNGAALPTPDLVGPTTINLSGTAGKVALVNTSTVLNGTTACNHASVVDMIGFSTTANAASCFEGTAFVTTGIDNGTAMFRKNNGCTDTNDNSADFLIAATAPRNSASAANICPVSTTPALSTTGTIADFGNVVILTNSASQSFTVSGANLTGAPGNITVTAPSTDFQVSLDNTTWTASVTIPYTTATLAATTVHVRFTPQTVGLKTGNISIVGGGTSTSVAVSGTGANVNPSVLAAGTLAGFGNVCIPNSVGPNVVNLGGANLIAGNVVVGPLAGYTFSTSAAGTYSTTLTITQAGGTFSQAVYVKFTPTAAQTYNGNIPVTGGGANAISIAITGSGVNTPPAVTTNAASSIGVTSAQLNGTVTANGCSDVTFYGFEYSTIGGFANGTGTVVRTFNMTTGNYSTVLNALAPNSVYYFKAYAQNGNGKTYGAQQSFTTGSVGKGLIVYSTPIQRGGTVHYSLDTVKRGHYATVLYNMAGQKVYRKEMIVQVGFINDQFKLPGYLPAGSYILQIENYEFKVRKQILVK